MCKKSRKLHVNNKNKLIFKVNWFTVCKVIFIQYLFNERQRKILELKYIVPYKLLLL